MIDLTEKELKLLTDMGFQQQEDSKWLVLYDADSCVTWYFGIDVMGIYTIEGYSMDYDDVNEYWFEYLSKSFKIGNQSVEEFIKEVLMD